MGDQPYTPDIETVCEQYAREQPPHIATVTEKRAEFFRWLAAREHDIRAETKRNERKRLKGRNEELARECADSRLEIARLRSRVESLENSLEARDRHIDVVNARAEGARAAAERIAEVIGGEMNNEEMKPETPSSTGRWDGLYFAERIARQEAGA